MKYPGQLPIASPSGPWNPNHDLGLHASVSSSPALLLLFLMCIGIPGNLTVFCLYAARMRRTVAGVFFTCLSAFNAFTVAVVMPLDLYDLLHRFEHRSTTVCRVLVCLFFYAVVGPLVILVVIVIERTVKTCLSRMHANGLRCMKRILVFLAISTVGFAGPLYPLVSLQNSGEDWILEECGLREDINTIGILFFFFTALLLATVVFVVCFTLILMRIPYFVKPSFKRQSELALESALYWDMDTCYRYRAIGPYSDASSDIDLPIAPHFLLFQHDEYLFLPFRFRPPSHESEEPDPEMRAVMQRLTGIPEGTAVGGTGFLVPKRKPKKDTEGDSVTFRELIMSPDPVRPAYWVELMQLVSAGAITLDEAARMFDEDEDDEGREYEDEADDVLTDLSFPSYRFGRRLHSPRRRGPRQGGVTFDTREYYSPSPPPTHRSSRMADGRRRHSDNTSNALKSRNFDNKTDNNPAVLEETSRQRLEDRLMSTSLLGTNAEHSDTGMAERPEGDKDGREKVPETDGGRDGRLPVTKSESTAIYVKGYGWWVTSGTYGVEGMAPWCGDPSPSASRTEVQGRSHPTLTGQRRVADSTRARRAGMCVGYPLDQLYPSYIRLGDTERSSSRTLTEGAPLPHKGPSTHARKRVRVKEAEDAGTGKDKDTHDEDDIETPRGLLRRKKAALSGETNLRSGLFKWSSWIDDFYPPKGDDTDIGEDNDNNVEGFERERMTLPYPERDEAIKAAEEKEGETGPFPPSPRALRWGSDKDHQSETRSSPFEQKQSPKSKGKDKFDTLIALSESEHSQMKRATTSEEDREMGEDLIREEALTPVVITTQPQRQASALEDIVEEDDGVFDERCVEKEEERKTQEELTTRKRGLSTARSWHSRAGGSLLQQRQGSRHSFTDIRDASAESHSFIAQVSTHYLPTETAAPAVDHPSPRKVWDAESCTPTERGLQDQQRPASRIGWSEDSTERTARDQESPSPRKGWGQGATTSKGETMRDPEHASHPAGRKASTPWSSEQTITDQEQISPRRGRDSHVPSLAEQTLADLPRPGTSFKGPLERLQSYLTSVRKMKRKVKGKSSIKRRSRLGDDSDVEIAVVTSDDVSRDDDKSKDVESGDVTEGKGHSMHEESSTDSHPGLRAVAHMRRRRPWEGHVECREKGMDATEDEKARKYESVMSLESVESLSDKAVPTTKQEKTSGKASGSKPTDKSSERSFDTSKPQKTCWETGEGERASKEKQVSKSKTQLRVDDISATSTAKEATDGSKRPITKDKRKTSPEKDDAVDKIRPSEEGIESSTESDANHSNDEVDENANAYDAESDESEDLFFDGNRNTNALENNDDDKSSVEERGEKQGEKKDDDLVNTTQHAKARSHSSAKESHSDFSSPSRTKKRKKKRMKRRARRRVGSLGRQTVDTNASSTDEYYVPSYRRIPRSYASSRYTSPHQRPRPGIRVRKFLGAGPICDYRLEPSMNIVQEIQAKASAAVSTISHITTELTPQMIFWRLTRCVIRTTQAFTDCCDMTTDAIKKFFKWLIFIIIVGPPKRCRTTLTLFAITVVLLLSYYPFAFVVFLTKIIPQRMDVFRRTYPWLHQCLLRSVYFSQGLNPFIFLLFSRKYRAALQVVMSCPERDAKTIPAL